MPKRGETRPYRVRFQWPGALGGTAATCRTYEDAATAARRQADVVGPGGDRCVVTVTHRDQPNVVLLRLAPGEDVEPDPIRAAMDAQTRAESAAFAARMIRGTGDPRPATPPAPPRFVTFTVVTRAYLAEDLADALSRREGIVFAGSEPGVTPAAVAAGADPSMWDDEAPCDCEPAQPHTLAEHAAAVADLPDDETTDATGAAYPRGRCDTCGAPCRADSGMCSRVPGHVVALA